MYIPQAFRKEDIQTLHTFMQAYSFATLVTQQNGMPFATHLPFLLDTGCGPYGTLLAHMARANPQWRDFNSAQEVLVIFQGPHAYISPSWYEVELSVPTWNYAAVHAYGLPRLIEDREELYKLLKTLIQTHESHFEKPWPFQLPDDYLQKMMRGIVGFEIEITRLEGKFKLSQNRTEVERENVIAALQESSDKLAVNVAELMKRMD
jgi:transcriptional regulator